MTALAPHGTYARYANPRHGCRCPRCREAKRVYTAARRASGAEPMHYYGDDTLTADEKRSRIVRRRVGVLREYLPNVPHGTTASYNRGCRCWPCTDAKADTERARRTRKQRAA